MSKIAAGLLAMASPMVSFGQTAPRISGPINDSALTTLKGTVHPFARARFDRGPVEDSHVGRMVLVLKRSPEQQAALEKLIADQQDAGSANFHKWLTPEQFGEQFGVADADLQTVAGYLQDKGFSVGRIYKNHGAIEVSGTAGQLRDTFHTQIHRYSIGGKEFFANSNEPKIPTALASVVRGFASLNNIETSQLHAQAESVPVTMDPETKRITPSYTGTLNGTPIYLLAPTDIQSIYDIPVLTTSPGGGGTGVTVGVVGDSQVNLDLIARYQSLGGAGKTTPTEIVDGNDPSILAVTSTTPDATIAYQQIELIGAAAPYANINYYVSATTDYDSGVNFALIRAVEDNVVSVLAMGFQTCEANLGPINNGLVYDSWLQAAAQGITVVAAAGDSGSAGCDLPGSTSAATSGLGINGYASTPYNVAVGGTDFSYSVALPATHYWSATAGGSTVAASLPIPEQVWNASIQTNDAQTGTVLLNAGSGGLSTVGNVAFDEVTQTPYPVPSWQVNAQISSGIAQPKARSIPDVSFFAGNNYNYSEYVICAAPGDCNTNFAPGNATLTGGTAGAAAVFAGIMADVVGKYGLQGNANPILYSLSSSIYSSGNKTGIYHDVTTGNNSVTCTSGTGCSGGSMSNGATKTYTAGVGYDLASGLGSVDALNLINGWKNPATKTSSTALAISNFATQTPVTTVQHGTPLNLVATVTGSGSTPTGNVAYNTTVSLPGYNGISASTLINGVATSGYNYFLPGGTYTVSARYAGDTTFLPSVGTAPITVTPEPSRTFIFSSTLASGSTVVYGTTDNVTAEPFSLNKNNVSTPTGTLSVFTGGLDPQTVMALNSEGTATYNTKLLPAGSTYTVVFKYSGDPSYQISDSSATPYTITVTKAATTTTLSTTGSLSSTSSVGLTAVVSSAATANTGVAPTGTVTFTSAGGTQTVVNVSTGFNAAGQAIATATLPVSAAQTQSQVDISGLVNARGIYTDGTVEQNGNNVGLDGYSYAYSSHFVGTSLTLAGTNFTIIGPDKTDMVKGANTAPVIPLTSGNYTSLQFLGTAVNGSQPNQVFTVTYTDGTTQQFTQSMSDWYYPQSYAGENVAVSSAYRDTAGGGNASGTFDLYEYSFALNSAKTVKSLTLPTNTNVAVAAVTLVNNPAQAYTVTYSGDTDYATSTASTTVAANTANYIGTSGVSISLNNATVAANGPLTITATATQSSGTPAGTVQVFADGVSIGSFPISSGSATAWTVPLTNGYLPLTAGTVTLTAVFTPSSTSITPSSTSTTVTVTDDRTTADFAITTDTRSQTISSSTNSTYFQVQLTSLQNMAGSGMPINLTCTVPTNSNLGCSLAGSVTLDSTGSAVVAMQIYGQPTGGTGSLQQPVPAQHWWLIGGGSTLACIFLLGIPARRKTWQGLMGFIVCAIVITGSITGCGTNSLAAGQTGTTATSGSASGGGASGTPGYTNGLATNNVNPGTYTVVVTGTATTNTKLVHNTAVTVVVTAGQTFVNGSYTLTSVHASPLTITDPSANTAPGTGLVLNNPDNTSDQKWVFTYKSNGYFTITNAANGLYITDPSGNTGIVQVTQASLIGTVASPDGTQLWTLQSYEGGYEIVNATSGGVLDDYGQATTPGTYLICYPQKPITDGANQTWYIQSAP